MTIISYLKSGFMLLLWASTVMGISCGGSLPPSISPILDSNQVVASTKIGNPFPRASRVVFNWSIREPNLRVGGEGVARLEPPDRARLDLFLDNGETLLAVALVDNDLRAPRETPMQVIPAPPLLWASMGVFKPGDSLELLGAGKKGEITTLGYKIDDDNELWYQIIGDKIVGVELFRGGSVLHRVSLDHEIGWELPSEAVYRNLGSFREVKITVKNVEYMDPYPSNIWSPHK
tara:strand:+ start:7669 stop:8367 length:699 start_codon:yes stop_codon:yes gene_type:complete